MRPKEWGLLVLLSILFGSSFFFYGVAVKELPTFSIVFARVVVGSLVLLVVMRFAAEKLPKSKEIWIAFAIMALLNNVIPFSLIAWGQIHVASGVASILNATTPMFGVIVAHFFTDDESISVSRVIGVLVGLFGVTVVIGFSAFSTLGLDLVAPLAIVGGALSYSFASVFGRRFRARGVTPLASATGQVMASSVILIPVVLIVDQPWDLPAPTVDAIGSILGLGVLSTGLAFIVYFRLLSTAGANNVLLVTFLLPITAILLGVLVLNEVLQAQHIQGIVLVAFGLIILDGRLWRLTKRLQHNRAS